MPRMGLTLRAIGWSNLIYVYCVPASIGLRQSPVLHPRDSRAGPESNAGLPMLESTCRHPLRPRACVRFDLMVSASCNGPPRACLSAKYKLCRGRSLDDCGVCTLQHSGMPDGFGLACSNRPHHCYRTRAIQACLEPGFCSDRPYKYSNDCAVI